MSKDHAAVHVKIILYDLHPRTAAQLQSCKLPGLQRLGEAGGQSAKEDESKEDEVSSTTLALRRPARLQGMLQFVTQPCQELL